MSKNALSILTNITNQAITAITPETVMNCVNPIPAAYLVDNERPVLVTVTRGTTIATYHATTGVEFVDAPIPTTDGWYSAPQIRNWRDWDYVLRTLLLNQVIEEGDVVEVSQNSSYAPIARLEFIQVDNASSWSRDGIRQPVEQIMVTGRAVSRRFYGDNGYWTAQATGSTHPVTGQVEPDLRRW